MTRRRWVVVAVLLLVIVGFFVWLRPATPSQTAERALISDEEVTVTGDGTLVFDPTSRTSSTGLILYPGGLVPAEGYAPLARAVAEAGHLVVIPKMPLNLAVLDPSAAREVIDEHPDITNWALGGHSLGGAMAADFVSETDGLAGLVMLAAYPTASVDLRSSDIEVLVIYGTEDGLSSVAEVIAASPRYPADTAFVVIEGGNHAQFGSYGRQRGDTPATISPDEQLDQTAEAIVAFLDVLDGN